MYKSLHKLTIVPLLFLTGCQYLPSIEINTKPKTETVRAVDAKEVTALAESMKSVSKDDALVLYKMFSGLSEYLNHGKKIDTTLKLFNVIKDFENDYGYTKEAYKDYTDTVEAFLTNKGYKKVKKIVTQNPQENEILLSQVISDISVLSESARISYAKNR